MMDSLIVYILIGLACGVLIEWLRDRFIPELDFEWWYRPLWVAIWPVAITMIVWGYLKSRR